MNTIFYLASCSTCQRIMNELDVEHRDFTLREIKSEPLTADEVDAMKEKAGSYEALFSRRAMKYRSMGLNEMELSEADYRKYILEEYTFLKRPVIWIGEDQFVGSVKKSVEGAKAALG